MVGFPTSLPGAWHEKVAVSPGFNVVPPVKVAPTTNGTGPQPSAAEILIEKNVKFEKK